MDSLNAFLAENVEKIENKKIVVSKRFKDSKGKPISWEIRAITSEENADLQQASMVTRRMPNGQNVREMDQLKYAALMVAASVVYPDLNNAALQDSYGVKTPEALLKKMLYPREENVLAEAVLNLSKLDDLDDLTQEAKN